MVGNDLCKFTKITIYKMAINIYNFKANNSCFVMPVVLHIGSFTKRKPWWSPWKLSIKSFRPQISLCYSVVRLCYFATDKHTVEKILTIRMAIATSKKCQVLHVFKYALRRRRIITYFNDFVNYAMHVVYIRSKVYTYTVYTVLTIEFNSKCNLLNVALFI